LGLCLLLCLLKMSMKDKKGQANCDKACGMLFFAAAVLIGVSQLLKETSEPYGDGVCDPSSEDMAKAWAGTAPATQYLQQPAKLGGGSSGTSCNVPSGWSVVKYQPDGTLVKTDQKAGTSLGGITPDPTEPHQPCDAVGWNLNNCSECGECSIDGNLPVLVCPNGSELPGCRWEGEPSPTPSPTPTPSPPSTGGGCLYGASFGDTKLRSGCSNGKCSCEDSAAVCGPQYLSTAGKTYPCQQGTNGNCAKTNCV